MVGGIVRGESWNGMSKMLKWRTKENQAQKQEESGEKSKSEADNFFSRSRSVPFGRAQLSLHAFSTSLSLFLPYHTFSVFANEANMNSIIEVQRQSHEEIERYEQALADILNKPTSGVSCLVWTLTLLV